MESFKVKGKINWEQMLQEIDGSFETNRVNIDRVKDILRSYASTPSDWNRYTKFDKYKYTRNLVFEKPGKFTMMILCWPAGQQSSIHNHSDSNCFVKVLSGSLLEVLYQKPENETDKPDVIPIIEMGRQECKANEVTYIDDDIGFHRMANPSHSDSAITLHIYCPPFQSCNIFDERTGQRGVSEMTFWSKYGEKTHTKKKYLGNPESNAEIKA